MKYSKQLLSLQQQIDILKQRGLLIDDDDNAISVLNTISYFRLAGYWRLMEADRDAHLFKPGSRFSNVISLYHFDEELRTCSAYKSVLRTTRRILVYGFIIGGKQLYVPEQPQ